MGVCVHSSVGVGVCVVGIIVGCIVWGAFVCVHACIHVCVVCAYTRWSLCFHSVNFAVGSLLLPLCL